ncbi:MAG TPA: hypothetical protein VJL88_06895, partial [Nitrospira sp.]|nr:hypothetical protein [Nitrospira sp.]
MTHDRLFAEFRSQISRRLQHRPPQWETSRSLIEASHLPTTLHRLLERVRTSDLPPVVQEAILSALNHGTAERMQQLSGPGLKTLTGLPPSKALRALCVFFDMVESSPSRWQTPSLTSERVAGFIRHHTNPFDLLVEADVASVFELGAGDLSFATELAEHYGPELRRQNRTLTLHCIDRLHPESKLGGPLHPPEPLLERLRSRPDVSFRFLPDQDMLNFDQLVGAGTLAPRYAVTACWAPATPTFAYEPTRLSAEVIQRELTQTKGHFRPTRYDGEPALEVQHRDRTLLFPPWKFEIRGPLALLNLVARSSCLGVLGAVDTQVFWELLAQLLEEERYRPKDQPFTPDNLPAIFGHIYDRLLALAIGETLELSTCTTLRARLPHVLPGRPGEDSCTFCSVV